jgi:hypothetical protein
MSGVIISEEDHNALSHFGIKRRSGRFPWGSGGVDEGDTVGRSRDFLGMVNDLRRQGMSDTDICKSFSDPDDPKHPFTTTMLRATTTIARNEKKAADISEAQRLKQLSNGAIAKVMGLPGESSVRALLEPGAKTRGEELENLAAVLKQEVDKKEIVDVGAGVEHYVGVNRTQFDTAVAMLESEGYNRHLVQVPQLGTTQLTTHKVLTPPGDKYEDKAGYIYVKTNLDKIQQIVVNKKEDDDFTQLKVPLVIDPKRVDVKYAEQGGTDADGVIYVRPGVPDVSLGGKHYAQVRIAVGGDHYLKGMAIYKNDLPDGVDLQFNTNKHDTGNKLDAMKPIDRGSPVYEDVNPFGSSITKQMLDPKGMKTVSAINIVNEEGDWNNWSKNLATQMLSKQQPSLAKQQLAKTLESKKQEFEEIQALSNPAIKRKLLKSFSDDVDSSSVHLKAAALPSQRTQVILPVTGKGVNALKETEVFAPNFNHGDKVVLVRYPHGGKFEIPELTVNNKNKTAIELLGAQAQDAIGIHPKVAERLSGADFDGDTVIVIPNNSGKVKSQPALEQLKNFDPKVAYAPYDAMRTIDGGTYVAATRKVDYGDKRPQLRTKQQEMGNVSNLITDMTIKGANDAEIARAVKHSMVVIDAEKHKLNYKASAIDNGISQLKKKYQGSDEKEGTGASTLISRTSRQYSVPDRKQSFTIDRETGEKIYTYTGKGYQPADKILKNGTVRPQAYVQKMIKSKEGAEVKDAHELSSGTPIERVYADHSNKLKALANEARLAEVNVKSIPYDKRAKEVYSKEVGELNRALQTALMNAPKERQAQLVANAKVALIKEANPDMGRDEIKKLNGRALVDARMRVGANKTKVVINEDQWEAIQAGAISNSKLTKIIDNADLDKVKELATPRQGTVMTNAKQARASALLAQGRTASEVATILGVAVSTLTSSMNKEE